MLLLSGLLNLGGPQRDRPLLANGEESEDYNDDEEDNKSDGEGAVMGHCISSVEGHFIEHLPPTLHKGRRSDFMFHLFSLPCESDCVSGTSACHEPGKTATALALRP